MTAGELALVAVQVRLRIDDLESAVAYRERMTSLGEAAADASAGAAHRLFVFPEDIGHFAPLCFAPAAARRARTVAGAVGLLAAKHPVRMLMAMARAGSPALDRAVLIALGPRTERLVRETFAPLARRCRATVVAGSFLRVTGARVTNSSYTFGPDGSLRAVTDKVNLVPGIEDASPTGLGLARGDVGRVPVVDAGWGRVATLICYDGFCEPHTHHERFVCVGERIDAAGVDVIANPAANPWPWGERWVFADDGEDILRSQQWCSEGLPATLATLRHARYGVTAHLAGAILDQRFEGRSEVLERRGDEVVVLAHADTIDASEIVSARVPVPARRDDTEAA